MSEPLTKEHFDATMKTFQTTTACADHRHACYIQNIEPLKNIAKENKASITQILLYIGLGAGAAQGAPSLVSWFLGK